MKTKNLITALSILILLQIKAQPYQEKRFNHWDAWFASGTYCQMNGNPGFILVSYEPSLVNKNFYIDRTDVGGNFTGSGFDFMEEYEVWYGPSGCGSPNVQATKLAGISLIETSLTTPTRHYALAGVVDDGGSDGGLFFATLGLTGNIVDQMFYPFPNGYSSPSKPLIIEASTTGEYYLCGSYFLNGSNSGEMYFLHVDASGAVLNATNYDLAAGGLDFIPAEMVLSPYNTEVALVGRLNCTQIPGGAGFLNKGFFMLIDESNLSNVTCVYYGQTPSYSGSTDDHFSSINIANSGNGSVGFVIGGRSDYDANNNGYLWALKIDPVGNIIWNEVYDLHFNNSNISDGVSIVERNSTAYGYTYYVAVTSPDGMIVVKLDDNGVPFTVGPSIDDWSEFIYDWGGIVARVSKVGFFEGASNDTGIHVYGDADMVSGSDIYLVEAAFNGYTDGGCMPSPSDRDKVTASNPGPSYTNTPGVQTDNGLTECVNISINKGGITTTTSTSCYAASLPALGSLNKTTGVSDSESLEKMNVYPNPSTGKLSLDFGGYLSTSMKWDLINSLGQNILKSTDCKNCIQGEYFWELNLGSYKLENGVYFLHVSNNQETKTFKLAIASE